MMFGDNTAKIALAQGFVFICSMCSRLHRGDGKGLFGRKNGQVKCTSKTCKSPLNGGSFDDYSGPLLGRLHEYCFVCGKEQPELAVGGALSPISRVGCCRVCLEEIRGKAVDKSIGGKKILWTTAGRVGPEKFEVVK